MRDQLSRTFDELGRMAAEVADGTRKPLLEFRDESERLDFHIEMVHVATRAMLWKMTEQMKVLKKFLDRQALADHR